MLQKECCFNLDDYQRLIETVVKVEYKRITVQYLIDYSEMINIATQTLHSLSIHSELKYYNTSYLSTAIKWAIRNEVRRRYKWYNARRTPSCRQKNNVEQIELQASVYSTILSIDEVSSVDNSLFPQIKDTKRTPDEYAEFTELKRVLENAISILPTRERELVEAKFFKDKRLAELSKEYGVSASRITRIIQSALNKLKRELERKNLN